MVRTRVLIGMSLTAAVAALLALDSCLAAGPVFFGLVALAMAAALLEFASLAEGSGHEPQKLLPLVLAMVFVLMQYHLGAGPDSFLARQRLAARLATGFYSFLGAAAAFAFLALTLAGLPWRDPERYFGDLSVTLFGFLYVWVLGAHVLAVRTGWGIAGVVALLATAKLGDVGAYFAGTYLGRHKLVPRISPNKTIEGALGGLAASILGASLVGWLLVDAPLGGLFWLLFGVLVGAAAQLGDLVESALKRSLGVKDSNRLLPQYGGVLDVIDSVLVAAPVGFWLLELWGRHVA